LAADSYLCTPQEDECRFIFLPVFRSSKATAQLPKGFAQQVPVNNAPYQITVSAGQTITGEDFTVARIAFSPGPIVDPPSPPIILPPIETLSGDQAALHAARVNFHLSLLTQTKKIRLAVRSLAQARRALRRAQAQARHSGAAVDPNLQFDVDNLRDGLAADRAALASRRADGLASISAARLKLKAFIHAAHAKS
jgi:hypothetical protein